MAGFYTKTFDDSLTYIESRRKNKKTAKWFSENISEDYDRLMKKIRDVFYKTGEKGYELKTEMILSEKQEALQTLVTSLKEQQKKPEKSIPVDALMNSYINKHILAAGGKSTDFFPPVVLAKFDGKSILETEAIRASYINLVYFDLFERFFVTDTKKDKYCHVCGEKGDVIGEVPFRMKFYGITNYLYFENLNNKEAYKSFSICRKCLEEVLTGMKFITDELLDLLLGIPCYLVPSMESHEVSFEKKYKSIFKLLQENKNFHQEIREIEKLVKKSGRKNFHFHLLFYFSPPASQAFDIVKMISDIDYQGLVSKMKLIDYINEKWNLSILNNSISLNDLRFLLFPSNDSHPKPEPALYRKDILDLLEAFIHGYPVSYPVLVKQFMHIFRLKFNRDKSRTLDAFKMVLLLCLLNQIHPLKGVEPMETIKGNPVTEIKNPDYQGFFDAHRPIYQKDYHRQGLFLLGTVIKSIVNAQRKKASKGEEGGQKKSRKLSSTFMKKLNYSGIPSRRVSRLVAETQNFYQIYDKEIYKEPGIWGNIMDRLQGIETSSMKPEEIVFYILTGISFAGYLGMKKGLEKKEEK
jgi:CRISPR-associated protein Csh1